MKAFWEGDVACFLRDDEKPHEYMVALTQAELDAERYRWLRDNGEQMIGADRGMGAEWTYGEALDVAIDNAMLSNVEFSGGAPLFGAASAGTQGSASPGES